MREDIPRLKTLQEEACDLRRSVVVSRPVADVDHEGQMVLTGNGLAAAHELFPPFLGNGADQAQLEAADQSRIRLNARGDCLRVHVLHLRDVRNTWHGVRIAADIDKGEHAGPGARQDVDREDADVGHPYRIHSRVPW